MKTRLFCSLLLFSAFLTAVILLAGTIAAAEPDWNQFRGPNHNNHSFSTGIAKSWNKNTPKLLWKIDNLGAGYSNVSFFGNKMFTMGDRDGQCLLIALDKVSGKQLWTLEIGNAGAPGNYGGPRSTPAVDGKSVFAYGQYGDFVCADLDGKEVWGGNVVEELGGKSQNMWGYASSPIFDGNNVILPVGGTGGTLVAFTKDGKRKWRSTALKDDAPYSSAVPVEIEGVQQFLLFTLSGLYGIDSQNGNVLWGVDRFKDKPVCSDPVYKDGVAFVSSRYDMGANAYQITSSNEHFKAEEVYKNQQLQNHHGGIVLVGDNLYFTSDRNLVCLDLKTGKILWENRCVGKGSVTYVDGHLIVRSESGDGKIALVEATPEGYREKGCFAQPDRSDKNSWTYPVVVDGKLYIRDQNVLLCYDLRN